MEWKSGFITLKALAEGGVSTPVTGFLLITSEVESSSTEKFVTFPDIKCRIKTK